MGTSVNQRSPNTIKWQAVWAAYQDAEVPVERVLALIWRAATNELTGDWEKLLSQPIVSELRAIAMTGAALDVAGATSMKIAESRQASFVADIAQRAAVQCAQTKERSLTYSERVFAEASNYLLSRDLPGFIGSKGRSLTVSESLDFKSAIVTTAAKAVREIGAPTSNTAAAWRQHVSTIVERLKRGKQ